MFKQNPKHEKCRKLSQQGLKTGFEVDRKTSFECQEKGKVLHLAENNPVKRHNLAPGGEKQLCREGPGGPGDAEPGVTSGCHPF